MYETPVTVIGSVVGEPRRRQVGSEEMIKFRVASNARRRRDDGTWVTTNSLFVNVTCWGRLVTGVGAALRKGAPVIVNGNLHTSEFEDKEGNRRQVIEMKAIAVGLDLSRTIARIEKIQYNGPDSEPAAAPAEDVIGVGEGDQVAEPDPGKSDDLPISA